MTPIAVGMLLVALLVWGVARALQRRSGLPAGRVRYEDTARRESGVLRSARYRLSGKPDYLLETARGLVPVEVKPTRRAPAPYDSDLMQLAAYCLLVEEAGGSAPRPGLRRDAEQSWDVPWDEPARRRLLDPLALVDSATSQRDVARSHEQPARCRGCGQRANCDQALARPTPNGLRHA